MGRGRGIFLGVLGDMGMIMGDGRLDGVGVGV